MPRVLAHLKRPVVEGRTSIDVRVWARQGLLRPGRSFHCSWSHRGVPTGSIEVLPASDAVVLLFRWRASDAEMWKPAAQHVPITSTPCHFGGDRRWFRCAVDAEGNQGCGRRVAKLYLRGHAFACRQCCGLAYSTQSENPHLRAITKAQKFRIRLGGTANLLEDFPTIPPRMHARTYDRLLARAMTAQERWIDLERGYLRRHHPGRVDFRL